MFAKAEKHKSFDFARRSMKSDDGLFAEFDILRALPAEALAKVGEALLNWPIPFSRWPQAILPPRLRPPKLEKRRRGSALFLFLRSDSALFLFLFLFPRPP